LIEDDAFPFEFLSAVATRESWRKEVHRPIYHIHKWWAKRLGSVFRGILLGSILDPEDDLEQAFYEHHDFGNLRVLDPFMGSGTTIGEAHKLGCIAFGQDINPVAVNLARVAFGPLDARTLQEGFQEVADKVGTSIRNLYRSADAEGQPCDVLYYFWVMQAPCRCCSTQIDLFASRIFARNAYPDRNPVVQVSCPSCPAVFPWDARVLVSICPSCGRDFDPRQGASKGEKASCANCGSVFKILDALSGKRPTYRLYAKLVLTASGRKEYLPASHTDVLQYEEASNKLARSLAGNEIQLPTLTLSHGYNTRQAMSYGFLTWRDFFNERQLLALGTLQRGIDELADGAIRDAFWVLFSGVLEFNNMFTSYKGEGTGAVRHMFSHHVLKPERTPIEANVWGTAKSSGSFANLFKSRLLRAAAYSVSPTEVNGTASRQGLQCSPAFSGQVAPWPSQNEASRRGIYLSCGDSSILRLPDESIDLVVSDPPFFDNVHYSELADFFYAWQQIPEGHGGMTTRQAAEVQDANAISFARKLTAVLRECNRVLKHDGLLVFTYHHSRDEGWAAVMEAVIDAGFMVVNSQPVKSELSIATPKSQAKEPIQVDIILVCRKHTSGCMVPTPEMALETARQKIERLKTVLKLSLNDKKVVLFGQLLTTVRSLHDVELVAEVVRRELTRDRATAPSGQELRRYDARPPHASAGNQLLLWERDAAF
jgi:putative DNA methylase